METDKQHKVNGWGIDIDAENEPTYPMKEYTGDDHKRINWARPIQQTVRMEVLHSNERPSVSSVFGTTLPPKGLSGIIRRYAFKYSESSYGHWLPLLMADRVDVVEGILADLSSGRIPNIYKERGWKAEWKHKRSKLMWRIALRVIILACIAGIATIVVITERD